MGLVLLDDGATINTSGGVLHFTGFGWAGQIGEPATAAPPTPDRGRLPVRGVPGDSAGDLGTAGGFAEHFFMYCEDVDLSLKLRLAGATLAVVPDARVAHDYAFAKGGRKWRLLERNRWATMIRTYPGRLLLRSCSRRCWPPSWRCGRSRSAAAGGG